MDIEDLVAPNPPRSLKEVVERGLCSSCGACEGVLKEKAQMRPGLKARLRPAVGSLTAEEEKKVLSICPGAKVDSPSPSEVPSHPIVGPTLSVRKGYASDDEVRFKAAAAGGITGLCLHMLKTGEVSVILHISASRPPNTTAIRGRITRNRESLMEGAGSRYAPAAPLATLEEVLALKEPFAFVGKPCDVNAISNMALLDPRINQLCKAKFSISCGQYADPIAYEKLLANAGISQGEVEEFRYRGHGCPGWSPYARTADGREAKMDYVDFWYGDHAKTLTYQWRCKSCPDFLGYQADVTVMDCWPGGTPEHHTRITDKRAREMDGWVITVGRTRRGEELLDKASAPGGTLTLGESSPDEVMNTQPHQVTRAIGLWSRRLAHAAMKAPQFTLNQGREELMMMAAFDGNALTQVSAGGRKGAEPKKESLELVSRAAGRAISDEALHFHARNYEGTCARIARGDANEYVPQIATHTLAKI